MALLLVEILFKEANVKKNSVVKKSSVDSGGENNGRRNFLFKMRAMAGAFAAGMIGLPSTARAEEYYPYACCNLCFPATSGCGGDCMCIWGWCCNQEGINFSCLECMGAGTDPQFCNDVYCGGGNTTCETAICSYVMSW
jgi:hypothetical protein